MRRGCVYDDSDSGGSTDVETNTKPQETNKVKQMAHISERRSKRGTRKRDTFAEFIDFESKEVDSGESDADSVTGRVKSGPKQTRNVGRKLKLIPSDDEKGESTSTSRTAESISVLGNAVARSGKSSAASRLNTSVAVSKEEEKQCSPAAISLLDDLSTALPKRKAPPKKKAVDHKLADQSSIFDIF
jgi:hypothetical protein